MTSEEELASAVAGCEGLIVSIAPITRRVIESATALRVIGKHGVGTDNIDIQSVKENNIQKYLSLLPFDQLRFS